MSVKRREVGATLTPEEAAGRQAVLADQRASMVARHDAEVASVQQQLDVAAELYARAREEHKALREELDERLERHRDIVDTLRRQEERNEAYLGALREQRRRLAAEEEEIRGQVEERVGAEEERVSAAEAGLAAERADWEEREAAIMQAEGVLARNHQLRAELDEARRAVAAAREVAHVRRKVEVVMSRVVPALLPHSLPAGNDGPSEDDSATPAREADRGTGVRDPANGAAAAEARPLRFPAHDPAAASDDADLAALQDVDTTAAMAGPLDGAAGLGGGRDASETDGDASDDDEDTDEDGDVHSGGRPASVVALLLEATRQFPEHPHVMREAVAGLHSVVLGDGASVQSAVRHGAVVLLLRALRGGARSTGAEAGQQHLLGVARGEHGRNGASTATPRVPKNGSAEAAEARESRLASVADGVGEAPMLAVSAKLLHRILDFNPHAVRAWGIPATARMVLQACGRHPDDTTLTHAAGQALSRLLVPSPPDPDAVACAVLDAAGKRVATAEDDVEAVREAVRGAARGRVARVPRAVDAALEVHTRLATDRAWAERGGASAAGMAARAAAPGGGTLRVHVQSPAGAVRRRLDGGGGDGGGRLSARSGPEAGGGAGGQQGEGVVEDALSTEAPAASLTLMHWSSAVLRCRSLARSTGWKLYDELSSARDRLPTVVRAHARSLHRENVRRAEAAVEAERAAEREAAAQEAEEEKSLGYSPSALRRLRTMAAAGAAPPGGEAGDASEKPPPLVGADGSISGGAAALVGRMQAAERASRLQEAADRDAGSRAVVLLFAAAVAAGERGDSGTAARTLRVVAGARAAVLAGVEAEVEAGAGRGARPSDEAGLLLGRARGVCATLLVPEICAAVATASAGLPSTLRTLLLSTAAAAALALSAEHRTTVLRVLSAHDEAMRKVRAVLRGCDPETVLRAASAALGSGGGDSGGGGAGVVEGAGSDVEERSREDSVGEGREAVSGADGAGVGSVSGDEAHSGDEALTDSDADSGVAVGTEADDGDDLSLEDGAAWRAPLTRARRQCAEALDPEVADRYARADRVFRRVARERVATVMPQHLPAWQAMCEAVGDILALQSALGLLPDARASRERRNSDASAAYTD